MLKLALLGESYPAQLRENPQALRDVEVVWAGASLETFRAEGAKRRPDVLALDFQDLEALDRGLVPALLEESRARHAIVTYRFARRGVLQQYPVGKVRLMQGPISLSLLRAHVHLAVLDDMLQPKAVGAPPGVATSGQGAGTLATVTVPSTPAPPRYSAEQLGKLLEFSSAVQCECPSHLSQIVSGLQAFEEYSKHCENRNEADRRVHGTLYRYTAAARAVMEEALEVLVKHERIPL